MKRAELKSALSEVQKDLDAITDPGAKRAVNLLLNLVEVLFEQNESLRKENQELRDENNRLKGEQGKPKMRPQAKGKDGTHKDHSSENERAATHKNKPRNTTSKNGKVKVTRHVICRVDKSILAEDAEFKDYASIVIQDLKIQADNIQFDREVYYSPSLKKTITAELPEGYVGAFGPSVKALVLGLYHDSGMTQPSLLSFLRTFGLHISAATISRMLTEGHDRFHAEKDEIVSAGLKSTSYQHTDDTSARVNGRNQHVHILCNHLYTAFFTEPRKDRLTIIKLLAQESLNFRLNEDAFVLMEQLGLPQKRLKQIMEHQGDCLSLEALGVALNKIFPIPFTHQTNRRIISEAGAIAWYRSRENVVSELICDDAPQFNLITTQKGLCWVHEGRHYKKLDPVAQRNRELLDQFITNFWDYYHKLIEFKDRPSETVATALSLEFDELFSQKTGYDKLDERIEKTCKKKKPLLLVLEKSHVPLHNNEAELGARVQARKRDIHLQTINDKGTKAKDTFATIFQTAKKLGVNTFLYIYGRITNETELIHLPDLITQKARLV